MHIACSGASEARFSQLAKTFKALLFWEKDGDQNTWNGIQHSWNAYTVSYQNHICMYALYDKLPYTIVIAALAILSVMPHLKH